MEKTSINNYLNEHCCGCNACVSVCSQKVVSFSFDESAKGGGAWYPNVNTEKCINCGLCVKVCPIYGKPASDFFEEPKTFAAWNNDEKIRYNSSYLRKFPKSLSTTRELYMEPLMMKILWYIM